MITLINLHENDIKVSVLILMSIYDFPKYSNCKKKYFHQKCFTYKVKIVMLIILLNLLIFVLFSVTGFNVFVVGGAMVAICGIYTVLVSTLTFLISRSLLNLYYLLFVKCK